MLAVEYSHHPCYNVFIPDDDGDRMIPEGKICREMFKDISSSILTDEVIITPERIEHSNLHDSAYDKYSRFIPDMLADPDLIFRDRNPNTAVLIKRITFDGKNLQLVLRLHVLHDNPAYKNSILSFWDIGEKRRKNYERNRDIIYRKPET